MFLVILLTLFLQGSLYLEKDELHLIRKGVTFEIFAGEVKYNFTYDIWKNKYFVYNKNENRSFDKADEGILFIKKKHDLKQLSIQEKPNKKVRKRTIILFDFVSNLLSKKKRVIQFEAH